MQHAVIKNWRALVTAALVFVAPLNLFWQIPIGSAYVAGLRIDYLIPKLFMSWLMALGVLLTTRTAIFKNLLQIARDNWFLCLVGVIICIGQFFTERPMSSVIYCTWLIAAVMLIFGLKSMPRFKQGIAWGSSFALSLQLLLGYWQLITQHSFAAYHWFGESNISSWFGIAKGVWFGREIALPYGSTAHPNILANTIVVLWWLTWLGFKTALHSAKQTNINLMLKIGWLIFSLACLGLVISTQSLTGIFAAGIAGILVVATQKHSLISNTLVQRIAWFAIVIICVVPIGMWLFRSHSFSPTQQLSWTRRTVLFEQAIMTIRQHPLFGSGLTQSTIFFSRVGGTSEIVRFVQPVHNIFWLWLTETGIVGMTFVLIATHKIIAKLPSTIPAETLGWLILIPAAALDHFWLTQWPGMLIACLLLASTKKK